jgi:hypothetical protein
MNGIRFGIGLLILSASLITAAPALAAEQSTVAQALVEIFEDADISGLAWAIVAIVAILCGTVIAIIAILAKHIAVICRGWPPQEEEGEGDEEQDEGEQDGENGADVAAEGQAKAD